MLELATFGLQNYSAPAVPPLAQAEDDFAEANHTPSPSLADWAGGAAGPRGLLHTIESQDADDTPEVSGEAASCSEEEEESHSDTAREDEEGQEAVRERRDSGVGSSLTRAPR